MSLRSAIPRPAVSAARRTLRNAAAVTAPLRMAPSYLIIGAMKGGTTSLQRYLAAHPSVRAPRNKELHYFNRHHQRPYAWYLGHFPLQVSGSESAVTGDATPEYMFHPHVPRRVADRLPDVKLIAVLRDPVARAVSHYNHERAYGREPLSFEEAIAAEDERLGGEEERVRADADYYSVAMRDFSYVRRGRYAEQLERWLALFPREQLLVLQSEALFEAPEPVYARVLDFLGLPAHRLQDFSAHNARTYSAPDSATDGRLRQVFAPANERLYELIDERFDWPA